MFSKISHSQMSFQISVKNFAIFKGNIQRPETLLKDAPTQVFYCEYGRNFKNNLFYKTPLVVASGCQLSKSDIS